MQHRRLLALGSVLLLVAGVVAAAEHHGAAVYGNDDSLVGLAKEVAADATRAEPVTGTGSTRFDGEWTLVRCQMANLGIARILAEHPDQREDLLPGLRACSEQLVDPSTTAFARSAWGDGRIGTPIAAYVAVGLGAHRRVDPEFAHVEEHDRQIRALVEHLEARPLWAIETYPDERYPPDQAVVLAALALHPDAHHALLARATRELPTDPDTGLLWQAVDAHGAPLDAARGSGTAFAAVWMAEVERDVSRSLWTAVDSQLNETWWGGFGAVQEYPGTPPGLGDIDSGPLILGASISATGFALGSARTHEDREAFRRLFRTTQLFGVPHPTRRGWRFATGGDLGNAILLGVMAPPLNRTGRVAPPCSGSSERRSPDCG